MAVAARSQESPKQLDLTAAIGLALENNFAIRQAKERLRQREGILVSARALALPSVAATGALQQSEIATFQTSPAPSFIPEGKFWRLSLTASQTLYAGDGVTASIKGARYDYEAALLEFQESVNRALLQTRTRFYDVILSRSLVEVQQENLRLLESVLADTSLRARVGTISEFERLRAEVAFANAKTPVITAQNNYRLAIEDLRLTIGMPRDRSALGQDLDIVGALTMAPTTTDLQTALDAARENRPGLQRLRKITESLRQAVVTARASSSPQLLASGGIDVRKGGTENPSDSVGGARGTLQARSRVFDLQIGGRVTQAESQVEQARLAEAEATLAAELEVRRALSEMEQATELIAAMKQTTIQAAEAARIANVRYETGTAVQLDLLKAQVELVNARQSALLAQHGLAVSAARLRAAMGFADVEYSVPDIKLRSGQSPSDSTSLQP